MTDLAEIRNRLLENMAQQVMQLAWSPRTDPAQLAAEIRALKTRDIVEEGE